MDRHPDAMQQAAGRDHHLGSRSLSPSSATTLGVTPRRNSSRASRGDDLDMDPRVIRHAQAPGGIDRGDEPPRLHLVVGVNGVQQLLEPAIAAGGGADADIRRAPRAGRRLAGVRPGELRLPHRPASRSTPLADAAAPDLQGAPKCGRGRLQPAAAAAPASASSMKRPLAHQQLERALEGATVKGRGG